jgi:MoaA/NifB/PqqE/SkfB family radical SAM enzyme
MKNFAWIATWKITRRCNLYCVYCDHKSMRKADSIEKINYKNVIENIRQYSPKILNISGGEPTLVKDLPWIVSEIKNLWNPFIRIVHNGTNPEKMINCLPFIDLLVISMDGPDPINIENRGISGESVLNKLNDLLPYAIQKKVNVCINCVLTTKNIKYLRKFVEYVYAISPKIEISFTPIIPPDHELSILNSELLFNEFILAFNDLKNHGFPIFHVFDGIKQHKNYKHIQCYNQYFNINVTPEGRILTCAMNTEIKKEHIKYYFRKLFEKKGIRKAINRIKKKVSQDFLNKIDFSCNTICSCQNWLDLMFLGLPGDCIPLYARGLKGNMNNEDYTKVEAFVKEFINPKFNALMFKKVIENCDKFLK